MPLRFIYILIFLNTVYSSLAQEYNYQHYNLPDGLSGLTVYKIVQDKNGFIWFATETGLSRFDGKQFKNFSTADGLPDNEILDLYVDSQNRLWILPFAHAICYYKNGKIYSQSNDSLLSRLKLTSEPVNIIEGNNSDFLILETRCIHYISKNGEITTYDTVGGGSFATYGVGTRDKGGLNVPIAFGFRHETLGCIEFKDNRIHLINNGDAMKFSLSNKANMVLNDKIELFISKDSIRVTLKKSLDAFCIAVPKHLVGVSFIADSLLSFNCNDTVMLYNPYKKKYTDKFFLGKIVNCCFRDNEDNYWFATNGYGVYRLTTTAFINYDLLVNNSQSHVYSLFKQKNELLVGTNQSLLWTINLQTQDIRKKIIAKEVGEGRIAGIASKGNVLIVGSGSADAIKYITKTTEKTLLDGASAKKIYSDSNEVLIATSIGVYKLFFDRSIIVDTMWKGNRTTCALKADNNYYIGTLNGLYKINQQKKTEYLGNDNALLASRVSAIVDGNGMLWIATYGNGVVGIKEDKVIKHITEDQGLTSNMCRDIVFNNNKLWVGTDRGLNSITITDAGFNIQTYTSKDGLNSDLINCILVSNDSVFIGTPYGLVVFKPNDVNTKSIAILNINSIATEKNYWSSFQTNLDLPAGDNRFFIDYSCISFKSQGNIKYYYRLIGLDDEWHETSENSINYAALPPNNYKFELYAINAFGKKSNDVEIKFTIDKYFYQQVWFILLITAVISMLLFFFILKWIKKIRKNENEKLQTLKRLSELEQLAFRAQMNPHFIFNCLNSIQQYIFSKNELDANRFITDFASLIRQTMDLSVNKVISLEEETRYLTTYLKLEHTRFEENFDYKISAVGINQESVYLPSMLLQPFVENSIRHGIRNLKNEKGIILINFFVKDNLLVCVIADNGVGRAASKALKTYDNTEHESKGISLIERRIEMLNIEQREKIKLTIKDGFQNEQNKGTTVILQIPLNA